MTTVTNEGWNVSTTTGSGIDGAILSVFKIKRNGRFQYGDANGKQFPSSDAAFQYALDKGYLQQFVTPWCRKCRKLHTFLGKKSGFCNVHNEFVR